MSPATITKLTPRRRRIEHRAHDRAPKLIFHKPSGRYVVVYYPDPDSATRRFLSTRTSDPKDAARFLERERDRIGAVRRGHEIETTAKQAGVRIATILAGLVDDYATEQRAALRSLKSNVKNRLVPELGGLRADALTTAHVKDARKRWLASGITEGTVYRHVAALRRAYALAVENGVLARMPAVKWPSYDQHKTARQLFVTADELHAVNAHEPVAAARDMNTWAYLTGMRFGEIAGLTWANYDPETRTITLTAAQTKTEEPRSLPIPDELPELHAILARRRLDRAAGCPLIFQHAGHSLRRGDRWARAWKRAGLPMRVPKRNAESRWAPPVKVFHDLRRTAVRNLILAGVPEKVVMMISGHRTRVIFDRHYNVINAPDVKRGLATLGAWMGARAITRPSAGARRSTRESPATRSASRPARVG